MKHTPGIFIILILCLTVSTTQGQSRKEFIRKYKHIAIKEMERTGIPASITLAQGIFESGCGMSDLSTEANNHFGIKCHDWDGPTYHKDDDAKDECFRKYDNPEQSWIDHSEFLTSRPRYAGLFELSSTDYKGWAKGLKAAGYATNPQYADKLIQIIEEEELYLYDRKIKHPTKAPAETPTIQQQPTVAKPITTQRTASVNYHKREEIKNGILCIEAQTGDSFESIAKYYGIKLKRLLAYNEKKDASLTKGEYVFLKHKRLRAAPGYDFHRVKAGENLYTISQTYGVRLKSLTYFNNTQATSPLKEGEKIYLRKRAGK
ncbi:glucosaminidase domain-containing protein [Odoribacter lunatus]|uniref:glucosaminidase domain-containing protein n=1 Tax=Odoribacter lunatus TaxID=2941335 RepID=UPI0020425EBC|nr:glucosaminidase domain-containing protein [Odoribacter lunatus]